MTAIELNWPEAEVVALYNQGLPVDKVGGSVGYSSSGVRHVLRRVEDAGIEVNWRSVGRPRIDREAILERVEAARNRGCGIGVSAKYAAIMNSCSESTVWRALRGD